MPPVRFVNVDEIMVSASSPSETSLAVREITRLLRERHRIREGEPDDFSVRDMTEMANFFSSTTRMMTNLLLCFAPEGLQVYVDANLRYTGPDEARRGPFEGPCRQRWRLLAVEPPQPAEAALRGAVSGLLRSPLAGSRMYALLREAADGGMETVDEKPAAPAGKGGGPRVVVAGSALNRPALIECVEELGGDVVFIDTCFGARFYDTAVDEESSDPYLALAERYLTRASCPRMEGTGERIASLVDSARKAAADGVLYTAVKYCDNSFYEVPETGRRFREEGIPFLFIENDYEWANLEPVKTRVQAFLEMIRMKPA